MRRVNGSPRWTKALRDVGQRPGRSLLAVLAMAAGIFEIGAMLDAASILRPVLGGMYAATHPSSATLVTERVTDGLVDSLRQVHGVGEAESRPVIRARVRVGPGEWQPGVVFVVRDFARQRLDVITHDSGAWPPGPGEVLLERSAMAFAHAKVGDSLTVRTGEGADVRLRIAGTAHAAGLAPAWMEHMVPVFVGNASCLRHDASGSAGAESGQVRIAVAEHPLEEGWIREVADSARATLERSGRSVERVTVPAPGRHPHADQMEAFLFLLGVFGALSFVLGAVLTAGMVHALLAEQLRQVAVMKAIGATSRQIAGVYLAHVGMLACAALAIGVPAGLALGGAYARFAAGILNADVGRTPFPFGLVFAEVVVGLLVPLLVAALPVVRASRITVREALGDDLGAGAYGARRLERVLARVAWLPRPLVLSLRGTFAHRGRLALAVGTLALGGAAFIAALDVAEGWNDAVRRDFAGRRYGLTVAFADAQPIARVARVLGGLPEVRAAEYWTGANPYLVGAAGVPTVQVPLVGLPPASPLLALPLVSGRWLREGDSLVAVINPAVVTREPGLRVGGVVRLRLAGRTVTVPIVGVAKELAPMPAIYAPRAAVLAATGRSADSTRTVRVVAARPGDAAEREAARAVEAAFARAGVEVAQLQRTGDARQALLDHLVIIQSILTLASAIVVLVGVFALTSTLGLSVVQRTRELGVLAAIGARPRTIGAQVWFEALLVGVLSAVAANLLAVPVTWALENATGRIFLKVPLEFHMGAGPSAAWLALVLSLATISSLYPAWRASRLTVREALSHA